MKYKTVMQNKGREECPLVCSFTYNNCCIELLPLVVDLNVLHELPVICIYDVVVVETLEVLLCLVLYYGKKKRKR